MTDKREILKCPICGNPTRVYMGHARKDGLCGMHADQLKEGNLLFCEKCQIWHGKEEKCKCKNRERTEKANENDILKCIICGNPTDNKHFCYNCWNTYKNRSVDIRITNCKETQILDEYGNKKYKTPDGRYVRSRAEHMIIAWLWEKKVRVIYEETVYYTDKKTGEQKELHPDFYLPDYNLYIEYNELTNKKYKETKEYVMSIYKEQNKSVVIMNDADLEDISKCLCPILHI